MFSFNSRTASLALAGCLLASNSFADAQNEKAPNIEAKPQMVKVADKMLYSASISNTLSTQDSSTLNASDEQKIAIYRRHASFIKIHFSEFNIPDGSQVRIRNVMGTQSHIYGSETDTAFTLDSSTNDDGVNSFSALSILGETAIVEYLPNGNEGQPYTVNIDYIMEGYPEEQIEELAQTIENGLISPQSTCGVNERRDVQCWANSYPEEFERSRPVARLLINGSGLCTAWRVGPNNHMFTNNHCVESQSELSNTEVWFNYQRTTCGGSTNAPTTIVTGNSLLRTDYTLDYTLFSVTNFSSITDFGYFGLDVRNAVNQERIFIPQHGSGNPKELAIESDQNSGNLCRIDDTVMNGRGSNTDMGYYCDTIGGSSGSPVLAKSSNKVIALHHFGGCLNQGVRMVNIWPQVSNFFGGQVPDGDTGGGGGGGGGDEDTPLTNGTAQTGLSGSTGDLQYFVLDVPTGASDIEFVMSGGSGDADLYVRAGSRPTTSTYDCRPYRNGNNESCTLPTGTSGNIYVMLRAYSNYSGVSLVGRFQTSGGGGGGGSDSGSETNLSGSRGNWQHFEISVPDGASNLSASIAGGSGDADLYVRRGQQPTTSSYECRPYRNGNSESCSIDNPQSGTWYVSLRAYSNYSGVNLNWSYQ